MDHILIVSQNPEAILPHLPRNCSHQCLFAAPSGPLGGKVPDLVILERADEPAVLELTRSYPGVPLILIAPGSNFLRLGSPGSIVTGPLDDSIPWALRCWLPSLSARHLLEPGSLARLYQMGGRSLADRVLDGFLQDGPRSVQACSQQWQSGQAEEAMRGLRQLHERAGRVGATTLQDLSAQLEDRIHRGGEHAELVPLWAQLEKTMQAVIRMLEQQRRQERTA